MLLQSSKIKCKHCEKLIFPHSVSRHDAVCHLHPDNIRLCKICDNPIFNWRESKGSCSHACANKLFRTGENHGNWKPERYQTTCFEHHERKCVVCGEDKIVAVHHMDHNKKNNHSLNLIPLCPTHHQYWHSKYRSLIEDKVLSYIESWKKNNSL